MHNLHLAFPANPAKSGQSNYTKMKINNQKRSLAILVVTTYIYMYKCVFVYVCIHIQTHTHYNTTMSYVGSIEDLCALAG